jgi:hypothetical protein
MKNVKISAAVAAALMSSTGAFALSPADTASAPIQLVVAGASAARDTFAAEFQALCQTTPTNTVNLYRASPTTNADFRAYSCTLLNAAPVPVSIRNTNATVYYRSEGGSVWGPGSIAKGQQIKRLVVDTGCTSVAPPGFGDCAATYTLATEASTGHLAFATTDLGVADLEPAMFRGENWAGGALGAEPDAGVLEALSRATGFAQTFGILVNTSVTIDRISKQDVASIFQGAYSDWSQVRDPVTGAAAGAGTITVCRREQGSGTQVGAGVFFLNQNCSSASEPFVVAPAGPNGSIVVENGSTTSLEGCVSGAAGGIGPNIFKTSGLAANTKYLRIDNMNEPVSKVAAASGVYQYWFESSFQKRSGLPTQANALADLLISRARAVAGIPGTSASAFAVPGVQGNAPVLPVAASGTPVGLGSKGGNSCKAAIGAL